MIRVRRWKAIGKYLLALCWQRHLVEVNLVLPLQCARDGRRFDRKWTWSRVCTSGSRHWGYRVALDAQYRCRFSTNGAMLCIRRACSGCNVLQMSTIVSTAKYAYNGQVSPGRPPVVDDVHLKCAKLNPLLTYWINLQCWPNLMTWKCSYNWGADALNCADTLR